MSTLTLLVSTSQPCIQWVSPTTNLEATEWQEHQVRRTKERVAESWEPNPGRFRGSEGLEHGSQSSVYMHFLYCPSYFTSRHKFKEKITKTFKLVNAEQQTLK